MIPPQIVGNPPLPPSSVILPLSRIFTIFPRPSAAVSRTFTAMEAACWRHTSLSGRWGAPSPVDTLRTPSTSTSLQHPMESWKSAVRSLHSTSSQRHGGFGQVEEDAHFRQRWSGDCDGYEHWRIPRTRAAGVEDAIGQLLSLIPSCNGCASGWQDPLTFSG